MHARYGMHMHTHWNETTNHTEKNVTPTLLVFVFSIKSTKNVFVVVVFVIVSSSSSSSSLLLPMVYLRSILTFGTILWGGCYSFSFHPHPNTWHHQHRHLHQNSKQRILTTQNIDHQVIFQKHHGIASTTKYANPTVSGRRKQQRVALAATIPSIDVSGISSTLFNAAGHVPLWQAGGLNAFLFLILQSKLAKLLTPAGFVHSFILGTGLWTTLGWKGWIVCVAYLFLGSAVTKVKFREKEKLGIAESRGGRRGPENVWGSAATALACAILATRGDSFLGIPSKLYRLGYVASLATKLSDTFASEIGKAYGKTTFLITTLERVPAGTEGAISAEGTAASVVGGLLLSLFGWSMGFLPLRGIGISVVAAFVATNIESLLGATLQGKKSLEWITNEVVNFINTLIGAMIAIALGKVFL